MTPEEQAIELLPCTCPMVVGWTPDEHELKCPAWYRPAVTAALVEKEAEIQRLRIRNATMFAAYTGNKRG